MESPGSFNQDRHANARFYLAPIVWLYKRSIHPSKGRAVKLESEMIYTETIAGPWGPTSGSPLGPRLCWEVTSATLEGPRIHAKLVMPGADWIRLGVDNIRRQDLRVTMGTDDGAIVLFSYDAVIIRESPRFLTALEEGGETTFDDQYMRILAQFDTGDPRYGWLTDSLFLGEGRVSGDHQIQYQIYRVN
jgi:hypothetical protein